MLLYSRLSYNLFPHRYPAKARLSTDESYSGSYYLARIHRVYTFAVPQRAVEVESFCWICVSDSGGVFYQKMNQICPI